MGNGMNKILPRLYLGSLIDSRDWSQLKKNEITHIISILGKPKPLLQEFRYLCIALPDSPEISIKKNFKECVNFIHFCRMKGGNCLVHCLAGISRSTTIVAAYIMAVTGLSYMQVLDAVKKLRPCINPNPGFRRQLEEYGQGTAQEFGRHLREKYGESPFNDELHIQGLLSSEGLHNPRGIETNTQDPSRSLNESTGASMKGPVQRPKTAPERRPSLQELEQGSKETTVTGRNQPEPLQRTEDATGRANLQRPPLSTEVHPGAANLQERLCNGGKAAAARTSQRALVKKGPRDIARIESHRQGLLSRSLEGSKLQEPGQSSHRYTQTVLLRLKQNCSCAPRCLK